MSQPIQFFPAAEAAPVRAKSTSPAAPRDGFATALDRSARRSEAPRAATRPTAERKTGRPEAEPSAEAPTTDPAKAEETVAQAPAADPAPQPPVENPTTPLAPQPSLHVPQFMLPAFVQVAAQPAIAPVALAQAPVAAGAVPPVAVAQAQAPAAAATLNPGVAAVAAATEPIAEQAAEQIAEAPVAEALPEEAAEGEEQASGEQKPKAPVMPLARQHVPESLETVKATLSLTSHDSALNRRHMESVARAATQAPIAVDSKPVAAEAMAKAVEAASAVTAEPAQAAPAPEAAVRPWELHHPVQPAEPVAPQARVIEGDAPRGEAMPMREALKTPFEQAAREPGKPTELRLQLSPENLGRMQIRVVSHQGTLSAQIRVEQPATRDMMQVQMAELRQTLADQGIKIDRLEVNVGQDHRRPDQGFDLAGGWQQQSQQQSRQDAPSAQRGRALGFDDSGEPVEDMVMLAAGEAPAVTATVDYQA